MADSELLLTHEEWRMLSPESRHKLNEAFCCSALTRETLEKCASYIIRGLGMPWNRTRDEVIAEIVDLAIRNAR